MHRVSKRGIGGIMNYFCLFCVIQNDPECWCRCAVSHRQADMKGGGHPAQNGWIHVLRPVCRSHHHHLPPEEPQA